MWLIDKHAAHERINFDRLKAGLEPVVSQALLTPEAVRLPLDTLPRGELYYVIHRYLENAHALLAASEPSSLCP